jgi:hypothetical protein
VRLSAALLLFGCHPIGSFEPPPPPPEGARAAIVAFEAEELDVFAMDLEGPDPLTRPFSAPDGATISLLYLEHDLASMQLLAGRIEPSRGAPERSLPLFLSAFRTVDEAEPLRWEPIGELSERLDAFRLAGFSVEQCAEIGGCYLDPDRSEREDCTVPCPLARPQLPAPASLPELPTFEPCPDGWTPRERDSVVTCEPSDLASLCPAGRYAEGLTGEVVYVDPAQLALRDAIAGAPAGAVLALAKGAHAGDVRIERALSIVGACAAETIIEVPTSTIGFGAFADVSISGVTIRGGQGALVVRSGRATIEDAILEASAGAAIAVTDAELSLHRTVVQQSSGISVVRSRVSAFDLLVRDATTGIGMLDSSAHVERMAVERVESEALHVQTSTLALSDLAVRGSGRAGLEALHSHVTFSRGALFDLSWIAIWIRGTSTFIGSDLSLSRGRVSGLELAQTGRTELRRFAASEIDGEGAYIGSNTTATLEDVTIERDGPTPDPTGTRCGLNIAGKSIVTADRVHLERLLRQGLCVNDDGTATVRDVTALDVGDHGLYVFQDGSLTVERALLDGAAEGVVAFLRTELSVRDLTVRGMHGRVRYVPATMLGYPRGRGLYNNAMARVTVESFEISGCADAGLDLGSRDSVTLRDGLVTDNQIGARITFEPKHLLQRLSIRENRLNFASE